MQLTEALVEEPQVRPGGQVILLELDGVDVGLEGVHVLVLLLVQDADGAPGVRVGLGLVVRVAVGDESVVNLADGGEAAAEQVEAVSGFGLDLDRLLKVLDRRLNPEMRMQGKGKSRYDMK